MSVTLDAHANINDSYQSVRYLIVVTIKREIVSLIPEFKLGLWNAWIFMIWYYLPLIIFSLEGKGKTSLSKLMVSVPIRHEKLVNVISTAIVVAGFIYSIFLPLQLGTEWFFTGSVIFLIGLVISLSAAFFVRATPVDKPFTKGPYRYSRHPFYMAGTLIFVSIAIASVSWVFLILTIILSIFYLMYVPIEEQYCLKRYGKDYEEYMNRTPRWIGIPKSEKRE
jgi:protein-S-isoprenylcysteine O-methyltransferase Ste14